MGLLGYLAARQGWFSAKAAEGLALFVFDWAVPIMLVRVFASAPLPESFPWELLAAFYLPACFFYALGILVAKRYFARLYLDQIITGFAYTFGNSVLLGLPLILLTFGEVGTVPFFILLSLHGLSFFSVTTILMELGRNRAQSVPTLISGTVKGFIRNPIILGMITGLILNQLQISLPGPLDRIAEYMQMAVMPCALFSLGAALNAYGIVGHLNQSMIAVLVKNVAFPALVWVLSVYILELPTLWAMIATLLAAQPAGVNIYLFAQRYEAAQAFATTTVFLSNVAGIATLTVLLFIFEKIGW
jgi:predicted permease